ncbi:hypothetical protein OKA06_19510 [Novosphingobium sp. MW5]|nr:hypothetical protein [Novosphingobium sp. MW5]
MLSSLYMAAIGLLMISRLPTPSPKAWRVPRKRAVLVLVGVAVFAGALATKPWTVLVLTDLAYLVVLAWGSWRDRSGAGVKTVT